MDDEERIPPLPRDEWSEWTEKVLDREFAAGLGTLGDNNVFTTLARHEQFFREWLRFGGWLLSEKATLSGRHRELLILRTGFNCGSDYEWGQHVRIGELAGLTREEIAAVPAGPDGGFDWPTAEGLLLRAADELHAESKISDATWDALAAEFDERSLVEICAVVGHYHQVAFLLRSMGVQQDEGLELIPRD